MQFNWNPYAIGGATRPDSFSRMTPAMQQGLFELLQAADSELGSGLQVYSGYRSPELQARLFENAVSKYGSEKAARKWVAPPGRSRHNTGQAADLKFDGVRIDKLPEDHPARVWLSQNVSRFGLSQPMSWEPWQVEVAGARSAQPVGQTTGGFIPDKEADLQAGLWEALAKISSESPVFTKVLGGQAYTAPPPIAPVQSAPMQAVQRDTSMPYLELFRSLGV